MAIHRAEMAKAETAKAETVKAETNSDKVVNNQFSNRSAKQKPFMEGFCFADFTDKRLIGGAIGQIEEYANSRTAYHRPLRANDV
jgi:hypothetical protein